VSSDRHRENIRLLCGRMLIDLWPAYVQGVANVLANGLSTGPISARSDAWSFNSHIMAWWVSLFRRFDVNIFRTQWQPGAGTNVSLNFRPPTLEGEKVWASPPISLIPQFIQAISSELTGNPS
jgi:hypothetical protein